MDRANYQLPQVLEPLGRDRLQHILEQCGSFFPCPLYVLSPEGDVVVAANVQEEGQRRFPRFHVKPEEQGVAWEREGNGSVCWNALARPLHVHGEMCGYVAMIVEPSVSEDQRLQQGLQFLADIISEKAYSEYELENLTEELIEKYNEVNLIYDISDALSAVLDAQRVCEVIIEKAVEVIGVERASIMLYDEKKDRLRIKAAHGLILSHEELFQVEVAPDEGVSGKVFQSGEHLLIENIHESLLPGLKHEDRQYKSLSFLSVPMICTPKQAEKKVMGVINMTDKKSSEMFTSGDLRLLTAVASQAAISLYNIELIEEVKDAERVKREMEIAQQIQMGLLPGNPPSIPGIELAGRCLPATQVGGDYYDFFLSSDNKLGVVIADVSGHNVGAALMMAAARSALRSEVLTQQSPAAILKNTNFVLYDDLTHAELFMTMFYAEYEARTKIFCYSNGGHNHPILLRERTCSFLDTDGMLIGMLASVDFEEKRLSLQPNDFVIFYTDGVVEAVNEEGKMFKLDRLCRVIEANWQCNAQQLVNKIFEELDRYTENTFRSDDITVVVLKVH
ncbi:serine phosphatase [Candidatus Vecturithrix granuli]|uniref:Serine phosphatase n=1 Tax=Vecturithrix granuli TaxID=1499967 RepID=A0A081BUN1_VECG1|nr:serine phosphatase [Candidatus Vecturithrix granuli]